MLKQRQVLTLLALLVQKVHIVTVEARLVAGVAYAALPQFTCFTSTKVQIVTGEARLVAGVAYAALPQSGGALR
jgi:orotate phosphoribosyltransferase